MLIKLKIFVFRFKRLSPNNKIKKTILKNRINTIHFKVSKWIKDLNL